MDTPTQTAAVTGNDNIVVLAKDSDVTITPPIASTRRQPRHFRVEFA